MIVLVVMTVCRVPRLNLSNVVDKDDVEVDYTFAMDSPLVAAAAGYGCVICLLCYLLVALFA